MHSLHPPLIIVQTRAESTMLNRPRRLRAYRPTTDTLESLCLLSTMGPGLSKAPALAALRPEGRDAGTSARASRPIAFAPHRVEARTVRPRIRLNRDIRGQGRPGGAAPTDRGPGPAADWTRVRAVSTAGGVYPAAKATTGP